MDFEEAKTYKESLLVDIAKQTEWELFIVPKQNEDFARYSEDAARLFLNDSLYDEFAIPFSSDGQYSVWYMEEDEGAIKFHVP